MTITHFRLRQTVLVIALTLHSAVFSFAADDPLRVIAILENERRLTADPDIHLTEFFTSSDAAIRNRAVLAAARIGNKEALVRLIRLVNDPVADVRKTVAFALGQIKSKEGLNAATQMLKDADKIVRRYAVEAVGRIGGLEASPFIVPFLDDPDAALREQAALSLALIQDQSKVGLLVQKLSREDPAQWSYVYALYRLANEQSVEALHRVLAAPSASPSTGDPSSLLFALKALWSMKKPLSQEEANLLLKHSDPRVQQNALDVISVSGDKSVCSLLEKSYSGMNVLSKGKAIEAAGALNCPILLDAGGNNGLKGALLAAKAKANKDEALPELKANLASDSWIIRWRVAQALANLSPKNAIPLLTVLAEDQDSAVKLAALESLGQFASGTSDFFLPLLKHSDFTVRAVAADTIGKTKVKAYLPQLIDAYKASTKAAEIEGRVAVLDALSEYKSGVVLEVYLQAANDPEYTIRSHAVEGIKKLVGTKFYRDGKVVDPEEFLYLKGKVSRETLSRYPADFGKPAKDFRAEMALEKGTVILSVLASEAPVHALNFKKLAQEGVYDGLRIHRVVPNFVIQGGDPRGDGWGGAGEIIHDQINLRTYLRGIVGMPIAGKDTGGSQFFITHSRQPHLDGNYTVFAEVVSGMEVVDTTEIGDRILNVKILSDAQR